MASHSRTKGKARKSAASSARSGATSKPSTQRTSASTPKPSAAQSDDDFRLSKDQIAGITRAALKTYTDQQGMDSQPATDHAARVDEALRGIHPTVAADAPKREQIEEYLFSSIITGLRAFWDGRV